ncbi:hypothetical protein KP509_1Z250400 [Ceratopteris richardii]|nr:hypothetical protein KP509_1Z250400 [Ceratopteris richardii]
MPERNQKTSPDSTFHLLPRVPCPTRLNRHLLRSNLSSELACQPHAHSVCTSLSSNSSFNDHQVHLLLKPHIHPFNMRSFSFFSVVYCKPTCIVYSSSDSTCQKSNVQDL